MSGKTNIHVPSQSHSHYNITLIFTPIFLCYDVKKDNEQYKGKKIYLVLSICIWWSSLLVKQLNLYLFLLLDTKFRLCQSSLVCPQEPN